MDEKYIQKVLAGDVDSFRYFVSNYKGFAFSIALAIVKDEYLAEEVVQESFIKVFKGLKSFKGKSKFKTWLCRIVINESLKKSISQKSHNTETNEIPEKEIPIGDESFNELLLDEQRHYINTVLKLLPPEESLSLELYYLQEQSIEEIIAATGWSVSKTKMLLHRGRKSFYLKLERLLKAETKNIL